MFWKNMRYCHHFSGEKCGTVTIFLKKSVVLSLLFVKQCGAVTICWKNRHLPSKVLPFDGVAISSLWKPSGEIHEAWEGLREFMEVSGRNPRGSGRVAGSSPGIHGSLRENLDRSRFFGKMVVLHGGVSFVSLLSRLQRGFPGAPPGVHGFSPGGFRP